MATITIRCTKEEKDKIKERWQAAGFSSESEYMRFIALNAEIKVIAKKSE